MKTDDVLKYLANKENLRMCEETRGKAFSKNKQGSYWNEVGVCNFMKGDYNKAIFYLDMSLKKSDKKSSIKALNNLE